MASDTPLFGLYWFHLAPKGCRKQRYYRLAGVKQDTFGRKCVQMVPRWSQMEPKGAQKVPKWCPNGAKCGQKGLFGGSWKVQLSTKKGDVLSSTFWGVKLIQNALNTHNSAKYTAPFLSYIGSLLAHLVPIVKTSRVCMCVYI